MQTNGQNLDPREGIQQAKLSCQVFKNDGDGYNTITLEG